MLSSVYATRDHNNNITCDEWRVEYMYRIDPCTPSGPPMMVTLWKGWLIHLLVCTQNWGPKQVRMYKWDKPDRHMYTLRLNRVRMECYCPSSCDSRVTNHWLHSKATQQTLCRNTDLMPSITMVESRLVLCSRREFTGSPNGLLSHIPHTSIGVSHFKCRVMLRESWLALLNVTQ